MAAENLGVFETGFASWSRILTLSKNDAVRLVNFTNATTEAVTYVGKGLEKATAVDELYELAFAHGLVAEHGEEVIQQIIADAFEPPKPNGHDGKSADAFAEAQQAWERVEHEAPEPSAVKHATLYAAPDPASIPKRAWLHGGHYIRQAATATVAPGGFGKTTLVIYEAISMVAAGLAVWYLSGEDPKVEIDRRIAAHCTHHGIDLAQLPGRLFVDDRSTFQLFIGVSPRTAAVKFDEASLGQFETAIDIDAIDVVVLDPFVSFHAVPENDNGCVDQVVKRLANVAYRTNSCIEISHHVRKPFVGQGSITVDDARGGGAIINAVRSGRVINRMTNTEAEQAKVNSDDRHFYIRVDRGKRNMAPPDKATWFRLVSVIIGNTDNVQALATWNFPALMDDITIEDTEWVRNLVRQQAYRADSRSDNWLGVPVAARLDLNIQDKEDCKKLNRLFGVWMKNTVFKKMEMRDPGDRKIHPFYVGMDAKPEAEPAKMGLPFEPEDED